jgi:type IV pilus assembly protein PilW
MNRKGITLIELMVAMVVSGMLMAGVYRTFVSQQHTYTVQEQVTDMQQNVRLAINRMTRELRMAGFGRVASFFSNGGKHGVFQHVVTPVGGNKVTVVGAYQAITTLSANATSGSKTIQVNDASGFNTGLKQYISINGTESFQIKKITGNQIELETAFLDDHLAGEPAFLVMAITYSLGVSEGKSALLRDDNLGQGPQPVAENIDDLQFAYLDSNGNSTVNPDDIRMIQVTIIARTDKTDPELGKVGDGFRRRPLTSNIQLRNLTFL